MHHTIKSLSGQVNVPVSVQDVQLYNFGTNSTTFSLAITTKLNNSYQNLVLFFDGYFDFNHNKVFFKEQDINYMSAITLNRDTFKVT